jgi:hypothetical protein
VLWVQDGSLLLARMSEGGWKGHKGICKQVQPLGLSGNSTPP